MTTLAVIGLILRGGGLTYTWVLHLVIISATKTGGRLIRRSTYMQVYMVVRMCYC